MALALDIFIVLAGCVYVLIKACDDGLPDKGFFKAFWEYFKPQFLMIYLPLIIAGNATNIMGTTDNNVVFWIAAVFAVVGVLWVGGIMIYVIVSDFLDKHKGN